MWSAIRHATTASLRVTRAVTGNKLAGASSRVHLKQPVFTVAGLRRPIGRRTFFTVTEAAAPKKPAARRSTRQSPAKRKTKKPAAKAKAAAPKGRPRKPLTAEEKAKREIRELKKVALLKEPARLPDTSWVLFASQHLKGEKRGIDLASTMKSLSASFKALSASELEALGTTASQNRLANVAAHKAWVESHTPEEIAEANRARHRLKKKFQASTRRPIHDDRQPKRALSAYIMFSKSRWQSGDFAGHPTGETAKALGDEWKDMSAAERKPFYDSAKADLERYEHEVKTVLNRTVRKPSRPSA